MDKDLSLKLSQIVKELDMGIRPAVRGPIKLSKKNAGQSKKLKVNDLTEPLEDLRLGIKYLLFDLEATKRENQYLKEQLNK